MENKVILKRIAELFLIVSFVLALLFHLLIIFQIIPHDFIWGGRLTSVAQMRIFEAVSIALNAAFLFVVLAASGCLKIAAKLPYIKTAYWLIFLLFFLNTIGNIFSLNGFERLVFTPLTFLTAVASLFLAIV